ncbi:putative transporter [uncultured Alistipes sp.]|uniref:putative transporter n=1 Tax=uncultured Alistipes sp. TaxID=538949 RepID=UPI0025F0351D|nr:putative transporter [uncultured Alistipes sp.]
MEWLKSLFVEHSAIQAVVVISLISTIGIGLGKVRFFGISLGAAFIFFAGILAGHFGLSIDPSVLTYVETFGLVVFVYALGVQVGPGFFNSLRADGFRLLAPAIAIVLIGTIMAVTMGLTLGVSLSDMSGILCGATTNTPALGAAQQILQQMGLDASGAALSCALTYPLGVVGVMLAILFIRKIFVKPADMPAPDAEHRKNVFIASYHLTNPAVFGKSVHQIAMQCQHRFVISRIWRDGKVSIPTSEKTLQKDDVILVATTPAEADALRLVFGEQEQKDWNTDTIDWNAVDSQLISQRILVTRPEINGKRLSALRLRNNYGINISRVYRSGVQLLATPELRLQLGDRLTVVGEAKALQNVEKILGNAVKDLDEPNLVSVFIGLVLGLILGAIPLTLPGISVPVKLGLAGGPIIIGILIGTFGPRLHMITYTTQSANLMLRALGLSMYLACLGLEAGTHFFATVMRPEGALWLLLGFLLTFVPVVLLGIFALRILRLDFGSVSGMLCGSMANPMALNYANDTIEGDNPSVSYATVYPLCMFLRVVIIQVVLMIFL